MEVLRGVPAEFPENKDFIEENLEYKCLKQNISVEQLKKIKKRTPKKFLIVFKKKFFLYFGEWNFLDPSLKIFLKKLFLVFQEGTFQLQAYKISYIYFLKKISIFNFLDQNFLHQNLVYQNHQENCPCFFCTSFFL